MRKILIASGIVALILGGCKNQPKNPAEQERDVPVSEKGFNSLEIEPVNDRFNELEMDTTYWVKFESQYSFATFDTKVFTGELADPDFTGNEFAKDKEYVDFITEGCNDNGVNFGGRYTIVHKSCGCMCEHIFVIDRISGKIFNDINITTPDDGDGKWGYLYKPDSKLLIANSNLFTTDSLNCYTAVYDGVTPELYVWVDKRFKRIQ